MLNTLELAEDLHARTALSERDATGIVRVIARALDDRTSQLVTRDQFDARFAEMEARFAELKSEVKTEIAELRTEVKTEISGLRTELKTEIADLRTELRTESANLRADMERTIRMQTVWLAGTMIAIAGLVVAVAKVL